MRIDGVIYNDNNFFKSLRGLCAVSKLLGRTAIVHKRSRSIWRNYMTTWCKCLPLANLWIQFMVSFQLLLRSVLHPQSECWTPLFGVSTFHLWNSEDNWWLPCNCSQIKWPIPWKSLYVLLCCDKTRFSGVSIDAQENGYWVHQDSYAERPKEQQSNANFEELRSARAQLTWLTHTRPYICFFANMLAQETAVLFNVGEVKEPS